MNRQQATELKILIDTVRHVEEMNTQKGPYTRESAGCLLCEGYRHDLYSQSKARELDNSPGFNNYFGCTEEEANHLIFNASYGYHTTGENYYQTGKELLIKYGFGDLFNAPIVPGISFTEIMGELKTARIEV